MTADPTADPTTRFGNRSTDYARARPGYPVAIAALVLSAMGRLSGDGATAAGEVTVLDVGCGTGLSALPFLQAGCTVIGVEPNEAMREAGRLPMQAHAGFSMRDGRAEATGLAPAGVDLWVAGQAFHWFDVRQARAEALRVLRRPAWAAVLYNDRVEAGDPFSEGYEALLRTFGDDYAALLHRHEARDRVDAFFGHDGWHRNVIAHQTPLDLEQLVARASSASYLPGRDDPRHASLRERLAALFEATAQDGRVTMRFRCRVDVGAMQP